MHKTISMSLQGVSYPIEEADYDRLDRCLTHVRRSFSDPVEAEEVANDVEAHMAERLAERVEPGEMVTLEQAEWLIAAIGDPADVDGDRVPLTDDQRHDHGGRGRRLMRSPDNKMTAGVCGGLAEYFGIEATWVRVAFVLAAALGVTVAGPLFGLASLSMAAVVGYVALWLFLPMVPTAAASVSGGTVAGTRTIDTR